jgi:hypothetical protein
MNDPKHERHGELAGWIDEDEFDPTAVDTDRLAQSGAAEINDPTIWPCGFS